MTNVLQEIFWCTQQHLKNSTYNFFCFSVFLQSTSLYIDMKIIPSSNFSCRIVLYSIFLWISRSNCSIVCLGIFFTPEHGSFSINTIQFTIFRRMREPLNVASPRLYWSWILSNFSKTKHWIWEDVYFCCWQLDSFVVQQSSYHPWNCIPLNGRYPTCISGFWSRISFCEISNNCVIFSKSVFLVVRRFSFL